MQRLETEHTGKNKKNKQNSVWSEEKLIDKK